jgi:hypothetical protein
VCYVCGAPVLAGVILNVLLFVPLGLALTGRGEVSLVPVVVALSLSAAIELVQLWIPGRQPSITDVMSNGAGAGLGVLLRARRWSLGRRHAPLAAGAVAAVHVAAALLLRPSYPAGRYWGQLAPRLGHMAFYRGTVEQARLGDLALPDGPLADPAVARRLLESDAPLSVRATLEASPGGLAPVASVADAVPNGLIMLGVDRRDLVFQRRTRAAALGLRQPDRRWTGAITPGMEGVAARLAARRVAGGWCLELGESVRCGLRYNAGDGWSLLLGPWRGPRFLAPVADALWSAALAFPVGALATGAAGVAAVLLVAVMPVAVAWLPEMGVSWAALAGGLVGVALGMLLRRARSSAPGSLRAGMRRA